VIQNGCRNSSNLLTIYEFSKTNKIKLTGNPCIKGGSFSVSGDTTFGTLSNYINWQYSTNGTSWNNYNIHTLNIDTTLNTDSYIFVRRMVDYIGYCEVSSNVIQIRPDVKIISQPKNYYTCSWKKAEFSISVSSRSNYPLVYWIRQYDSASHTWGSYVRSSMFHKITNVSKYSSTDSIQFAIQTPCGILYSNKALLKIRSSGPDIDTDPSDQYLFEGDRTSLLGEVFNPYEVGLSYNWQYRRDLRTYNSIPYSWAYKAPTWFYVADSVRNKLAFIAGICDDSVEYRFVANNGCNSYSYPARIFLTHKADLWMRDSPRDTGAQPNKFVANRLNPSQRTIDIYKSPDLFNCNTGAPCSSPQNAEFKNYGDNYIKYKIRNKGSITSKPAMLYLYWTLASTGEMWDRHWKSPSSILWKDPGHSYFTIGYSRFLNLDSGAYYPTGGQINSTGIVIPAINSHSDIDNYYPWRPPNPRWFHTTVNGMRIYQKKLQICLLARIEYCDEYPHKMAFAELYRVNVDTNVINNNNIVTHNLWVQDDNVLNKRNFNSPIWTRISQPREYPEPVDLHFDAVNPAYFSRATVIATLDDSLWNAWTSGGMVGTGFVPLDSQRIEITNPDAYLGNLYSDSMIIGNLGLQFFPKDTNDIPTDTSVFTLSQLTTEGHEYDGGVVFQIDFNLPPIDDGGGDGGDGGGVPYSTSSVSNIPKRNKQDYLVYPNPANTRLMLYIGASQNNSHTIQITDLTGKILLSETCNVKLAEGCSKQFDISHLAAGAYFVRLTSGGKTEVKKINILR